MRKNCLLTGAALLMAASMVISCNKHEGTFDPIENSAKNNPLQLKTTPGFTWETLQAVGLTVKVADAYNGSYTYGVQVFDKNPITNSDATLLAQGTATGSKPFFASIEMGMGTSTLYVRQTTPTGTQLLKSAEVNGTTATVDFNEVYQAPAATRGTRAKSDYSLPAAPDDSKFPTQVPADAQTATHITAPGNYILTESVGSVTASNVNLYVTGDVTLRSNDIIKGSNVNIYILPGAHLTVDTKWRWILDKEKQTIYIAEGAAFTKKGEYPELGLSGSSAVYNRGTMNMRLIECHDNSILYNLGSGVINGGQNSGSFLAFHQESYFINDGKASVYEFNEVRDDRAGNVYNYGEMNITYMTHVSAVNPVWVNEGKWVTKNFDYAEQARPINVLNKCQLIVTDLMQVYSQFTVDAGGSVVTKDLLMTKGGVNLRNGALFHVTGTATYKYDNGVFTGTGTENALLIMNCATSTGAGAVGAGMEPHYRGKLVVACDNYQGDKNVTTAGGAVLTSDVNNTGVNIPVTECNPGHVEQPTPPASVNYRYAVTFSGIYAMEDQWPKFGDYDMNDAVVKLVITAYGEGAATSESEARNILLTSADVKATMMATGADYTIGAYVQLDQLAANAATLSEANGIALEQGQSKLVLQLTNSISGLLGGKYVNVQGARSEDKYKTVSGKLTIPGGIHASDIAFDRVNFFITVNDAGTGNRTEIHLKNFAMTDKAAPSNDSQLNKYYTPDNFVWGVCLPGASYTWPDEHISIKDVNPDFVNWVTSGGTSGLQWYTANLSENITAQ